MAKILKDKRTTEEKYPIHIANGLKYENPPSLGKYCMDCLAPGSRQEVVVAYTTSYNEFGQCRRTPWYERVCLNCHSDRVEGWIDEPFGEEEDEY